MITKQNLWFITLFSLILILGIYYVSMPETTSLALSPNKNSATALEVNESDIIVALKVEAEEEMIKEMENAREILLDENATVTSKNEAYEKLQNINNKKGKIEEIEKKLKEVFNIETCVTIEGNKINVTLSSKDQGTEYANNIIKEVQKLYTDQMYITVKFNK